MRRKDMDVITNISGVIKGFMVVSSLIKQPPLSPFFKGDLFTLRIRLLMKLKWLKEEKSSG